MYTLDTNVVIYFLRKDEAVRRLLVDRLIGEPFFVSAVSEIELFSYPKLSVQEGNAIDAFLAQCLVVPVDSRIARIAASIKREYGLPFPDSTIAATAIATQSTLLTRNIRDFRRVRGIQIKGV